jgi:hypothetical protein
LKQRRAPHHGQDPAAKISKLSGGRVGPVVDNIFSPLVEVVIAIRINRNKKEGDGPCDIVARIT